MYKAFIFDHDGVLVDCEHIHLQVWTEFFAERGVTITIEDHERFRGKTSDEIVRMFLGAHLTKQEIEQLHAARRKVALERLTSEFIEVKGAASFIIKAHTKGIQIAIASGGSFGRVSYSLDRLGIGDKVEAIVTADSGLPGKPHPALFLKAAELMKVPPGRCLVFEDSRGGVEAARKAGMDAVFVTTSHTKETIEGSSVARTVISFIHDFTEPAVWRLVA